ncbi:transposase [Rhodococcus cerastii]|nr:transposase [Rhodococcus cerastii]
METRSQTRGPSFVTVIVDLTPAIDVLEPARLLDMVAGRSTAALGTWLGARDQAFQNRMKIVSMAGFAGYHTATKNVLPQARTVMDPFHVVHSAAEKLTVRRQCVQQIALGHRAAAPATRSTASNGLFLTRETLLSDKQNERLEAVFTDEDHIDVEVTERVYQEFVAAYADPNRRAFFRGLAARGLTGVKLVTSTLTRTHPLQRWLVAHGSCERQRQSNQRGRGLEHDE